MALILPFPPPAAEQSPLLARIRRLSRPLEWLFTALFTLGAVILVLAVAGALAYSGDRLQVWPGGIQIYLEPRIPPVPEGWTTVGALPWAQKLALSASACLMVIPALAILWQLRALFRLYGDGVVLEARNARCIAVIAAWLIAYAVAPTLGHLIVDASGFDDRGWLRLDSLQALLLGFVLFVVARVMHWGADIADDAARFI